MAARRSRKPIRLSLNLTIVAVICLAGVTATAVQLLHRSPTASVTVPAPVPAAATTPVPAVRDAATAFDRRSGEIVLFGGFDNSAGLVLGRTWTWRGGRWTRQEPAVSPPSREAAALVETGAGADLILIGGFGPGGAGPLHDMWAWTGQTWRQLPDPAPAFVLLPAVAWDGSAKRLILVGRCATPARSEIQTWSWTDGRWSRLQPAHEPVIESRPVMSAAADGRLLLVADDAGGHGATWEYLGGDWRRGPAMPAGYEPNSAKIATSGTGDVVLTVEPDVTLVWAGDAWRSGVATPVSRHGALVGNTNIVFFGGSQPGTDLVRAWRLAGPVWRPLPASRPR